MSSPDVYDEGGSEGAGLLFFAVCMMGLFGTFAVIKGSQP